MCLERCEVQESRALPATVGVERVQSNYDSSKRNNKQRFPCVMTYIILISSP